MRPILRRVDEVTTSIRQGMVAANAAGRPVPALDRTTDRLVALVRSSGRRAVNSTDGLNAIDVKPAVDWRVAKIKTIAKTIKLSDDPAIGLLLSLPEQARNFATGDLTGKVSDVLVAGHTDEQQAECGPEQVLIWQPERDACVRCLKYAGKFRDAQETFQGGLSFDPHAPTPARDDRIEGPPLHPHCRCELEIIPRHAAAANSDALKREAERSVLKGWALPSEGDAVRKRAAEELLVGGVIAPKTVIAETRRRLRTGAPFTRDVP